MILGIILNLITNLYLKRFHTTVKPDKTPSTLITTGPFSISRHPMYLGMMLILIGEAIVLGSMISFLMPVLFMVLMQRLFISIEGQTLKIYFPQQFASYSKQVRRWV